MAAPEGQIRRLSYTDTRLLKPLTSTAKFYEVYRRPINVTFKVARFLASLVAIAVAVNSIREGKTPTEA